MLRFNQINDVVVFLGQVQSSKAYTLQEEELSLDQAERLQQQTNQEKMEQILADKESYRFFHDVVTWDVNWKIIFSSA